MKVGGESSPSQCTVIAHIIAELGMGCRWSMVDRLVVNSTLQSG